MLNFARGLNPHDPYNLTHPAAYMQNVTMTLSGLVSTAAHPERIVKAAVDGFKKDPSEFVGRLFPNSSAPRRPGSPSGGLRPGSRQGAKEAAETACAASGTDEAERGPARQPDGPKMECNGHRPGRPRHGQACTCPRPTSTLPGSLPLLFTPPRGVRLPARAAGSARPGRRTLDQRLEIDAEGVVFVAEDGLLLSYPHPAPGVPDAARARPPLPAGPRGRRLHDHRPGDRHASGTSPTRGRATWRVLEQIDDRNGNWITFEYDAEGTPAVASSTAAATI